MSGEIRLPQQPAIQQAPAPVDKPQVPKNISQVGTLSIPIAGKLPKVFNVRLEAANQRGIEYIGKTFNTYIGPYLTEVAKNDPDLISNAK